jgi:diguanylate cyclase (GGDEF)-like protein
VFVFLICIFLPFAFIDSGGSSNNAMGYTFLLLIVTTYLFGGWQRISLIAALIAMFAAMHALEHFRPDVIRSYSAQSQFLDRLIQIPLLLLASFVIIRRFANEYERVNRKLNILAKYDELTGLKNRREFDKAVDDAFRGGTGPTQLAFLDLNNFKKLNDRCGHSAGDQALKELAALLQKAFDPARHVVSRWGGDEFAVVYYGEKCEIAEKMAWIEAEFDAYVRAFEETAGISTSIVSFCDYQSIDQMFVDADRRLYAQKKGQKAGGCA